MGFFGIGTWEILLILVIALIIWGPNKLPEIARKLGQIARTVRKAGNEFTAAVSREIESQESKKPPPTPPNPPADTRETPSPPAGTPPESPDVQPDKPERPPQDE